jgi:acyl-CoA dehydrogenase
VAQLAEGRTADALSGATPYQRLFGLVLTGCYLAKGGLADAADADGASRIALCRFAAENLLAETAALKDTVVNGAASLAGAAKAVLA